MEKVQSFYHVHFLPPLQKNATPPLWGRCRFGSNRTVFGVLLSPDVARHRDEIPPLFGGTCPARCWSGAPAIALEQQRDANNAQKMRRPGLSGALSFYRGLPGALSRPKRLGTNGLQNSFWIFRRDTKEHTSGAFRLSSALFPVSECCRTDSE